ncbi:hypothetical protein KOW79_016590 [Hemibagrus wyckioides]|uniref:Uncharacterized protein n=1 Tax=Hemibagrus wyckioides TaxID=337641 RepID=A0A9D3SCV2_9TELE|nr:hypothetical protein KOW79_016590 [Hemibagrus wyckioides]
MRFESFPRAAHLHVFATQCVERRIFKISAPRARRGSVSQAPSVIGAERSVENQQDQTRLLQQNEISALAEGAAQSDLGRRLYTSARNLLDGSLDGSSTCRTELLHQLPTDNAAGNMSDFTSRHLRASEPNSQRARPL